MSKAFLVLADGTVYEGQSIGAKGISIGETVFTTGMTGYLETLTDPSYFGQIVTQTFPLIGNYGVIPEDFEKALREEKEKLELKETNVETLENQVKSTLEDDDFSKAINAELESLE